MTARATERQYKRRAERQSRFNAGKGLEPLSGCNPAKNRIERGFNDESRLQRSRQSSTGQRD